MGLTGKHVEHRLWSLPNDEFSKRGSLCPLLADILSVRVVVLGADYELDGFLGVSDGVLHLLLRIRPELLGLVQCLLLVARGLAHHVVKAQLFKALLARVPSKELPGGVSTGSIRRKDPLRRLVCQVSLDGIYRDAVLVGNAVASSSQSSEAVRGLISVIVGVGVFVPAVVSKLAVALLKESTHRHLDGMRRVVLAIKLDVAEVEATSYLGLIPLRKERRCPREQ